MRLLVLGGTGFVGRHLVEAALARGYDVMIFNRGRTNTDLFPGVEKLRGDRGAGVFPALAGRSWDAAVDVSARVPRWVRDSTRLLADAVDQYTFVSSGSVYADTSRPGTDETAPVHVVPDETSEEIESAEAYGALKALCERAAEEALPGRVLSVRAGLIVGPHDPTGRFTYWVHRIAGGGDVLAPEPRDQPVQLIDARDLAAWVLDMAEHGRAGVYNTTGPAAPLTLERLLDELRTATRSDARLVWVGEEFLLENRVEPWIELPLWLAPKANPTYANFLSLNVERALAAGLRLRPLDQTVRDTLARARPTADAGLDPAREAALLAQWRAGVTA